MEKRQIFFVTLSIVFAVTTVSEVLPQCTQFKQKQNRKKGFLNSDGQDQCSKWLEMFCGKSVFICPTALSNLPCTAIVAPHVPFCRNAWLNIKLWKICSVAAHDLSQGGGVCLCRFCLLRRHGQTGNSLKKLQNKSPTSHSHLSSTSSLPLTPPQELSLPQNLHIFWKLIWHGRGEFALFPGAGDSCAPICGCLGKPFAGMCRAVIIPCRKEHSLHCLCSAHLCTELCRVGAQLSPAGGPCACTPSLHCCGCTGPWRNAQSNCPQNLANSFLSAQGRSFFSRGKSWRHC